MKKDISIGEIVARDFRAASAFKEAGIDFCCGGRFRNKALKTINYTNHEYSYKQS
jgi:iron-sulfur cluster repair protein YtfE (RIC family)